MMTSLYSNRASKGLPDLSYKPGLARNVGSRILTFIAGIFSVIAVLPLILVLGYVIAVARSPCSCYYLHPVEWRRNCQHCRPRRHRNRN